MNYATKDENNSIINMLQRSNGLTGLGNLTSANYDGVIGGRAKNEVLVEAPKNLPVQKAQPASRGGKRKSQPASRGERAKNAAKKKLEKEAGDECVEIVGVESFMNLVKRPGQKENDPTKGGVKEGKRSKKSVKGEMIDAECIGIEDTPAKTRKKMKRN